MSDRGFEILEPTSEAIVLPGNPAERLDSLDGKRIGLYANMKLNSVELMDEIEQLIGSRYRLSGVVRGSYDPSRVMRAEEWEGLDGCDAVLLTHGD